MIKIGTTLLSCLVFFGEHRDTQAQLIHIHSGAGVSATQLPLWTAKHLGIFDRYGFKVELVAISSGARGMQALVGGSSHSANIAAMSPVRTVLGGDEVVIVAGYLNKSLFKLVAQPDFRNSPPQQSDSGKGLQAPSIFRRIQFLLQLVLVIPLAL